MSKAIVFIKANRKKLTFICTSILLGLTLIFAGDGFNAWRAERYAQNACKQLYSIGTLLKEDMSYGEGISYLNPAGESLLERASISAEKAGNTSRYFQAFKHQVYSFEKNLKGDVSEDGNHVYSPYSLYNYAILPSCNRGLNFLSFDTP